MGVEWRDSLATGIEEIDDQHKELLLRFDRLLNACQAGHGINELKKLQIFLEEYVHTHFDAEEVLQRNSGYPDCVSHHAEHVYFIDRINKLKTETEEDGVYTHNVVETNNMLLKWLLNHISKVDIQLGAFLKSVKEK